mgnify:CR=1 FL=1
MTQLNLQDIFLIQRFTTSRWDSQPKQDFYFEIIFIEDGSGKILLNGKTHTYKAREQPSSYINVRSYYFQVKSAFQIDNIG